jgi:hypothetical protein
MLPYRRMALIVGLAFIAALNCMLDQFAAGQDVKQPTVKLGRVPELRPDRRLPLADAQTRRIRKLIADLANLENPDFGLSSTLSGEAFAPIAGQEYASTFLLTDHQLEPSETLKAIVAFGPRAVPFLLDSLDDQTPTKIVVRSFSGLGGMWHASELPLNPVNPAEEAVYKAQAAKFNQSNEAEQSVIDKSIDSYTVKIGDVCFVALGQIVGRSYQAVRYQPTANIVLNCPAHTPSLCADVRSIWKSDDPRSKVLHSLLADYATEGIFNGRTLDGWDFGSQFQIRSALRLLYYFPDETTALIANRLDRLDVGKTQELNGSMQQCVSNGVRADEFIQAVAWSKESDVGAALVRLFKRSEDEGCMLAALPAVENRELVRERLESAIADLPHEKQGPYGNGYKLLLALVEREPKAAKSVCERYVKDASVHRLHTLCHVLREARVPWDADLLVPMLSDKHTWGWTYAKVPGQNEPRAQIRICDEAAITLALNHPSLKFVQAGEHAELDQQIASIREALARGQ